MIDNIKLKNVESGNVLELDTTKTKEFVLKSADWGVVEGNHRSFQYVNQDGVTITGTSTKTRSIEIIGWIVANTEIQMTQRKFILNSFVNPKKAIDLIYDEYFIRFIPDTSVRYSVAYEENNELFCKFKINGMAPDPLFSDKEESEIPAANMIGMFHFPLVLCNDPNPPGGVVFGYKQPSLIVNVKNLGAVSAGMSIEFRASGFVENPTIINIATQEFFKINKTMVADEVIMINTSIGEKKMLGTLNNKTSNYFRYRDYDSSWLQLAVGDNLLRYNADSGIENLELYIRFHNKYLEVQGCF